MIARIEGADPALKNEYVIYTAHWDHLGRDPALKGDQIYNGAADNASGVASILEIAHALAQAKPAPKRSILFLAVTAEEKGLLGAKYYAAHPLYPLARTLADINLDVINLWGPTKDLITIGMGNSTLDDLLVEIAEEQGRTVGPDADPEKGYYFRSDHFEFAKQGVPALDPKGGRQYIGKSADFGQQKQDEYTAKDYHKVSDEVKPDWDLTGAAAGSQALGRARLSPGAGRPLPRVESRQRVQSQARGDAQGDQTMMRPTRIRSHDPLDVWRGTPRVTPGSHGRWLPLALFAAAVSAIGAWLDTRYGWITPAFDAIAHQFYEVPLLAAIRRPSQLVLVRWHLAIGSILLVLGLLRGTHGSNRHGRDLSGDPRHWLCDPGGHLDLRRQPAAGSR